MGVTRGLAGAKFSTSPNKNGEVKHKIKVSQIRIKAPIKSLKE